MMKKYEKPLMLAETFVPNQYVAACGDTINTIPAMTVRCHSDGHDNTARVSIFIDNSSCRGVYNPNYTDDNCHRNHGISEGKRSYGTGFVNGTWRNGFFTERENGNDVAYKGYFYQDGHRHLFYATTQQAEEFQGS